MNAFTRPRRFRMAITGIVLAAFLFRSQVAQALVVRGDDFMYRGESATALAHYSRALRLDPNSSIAADRYVFVQMERHTGTALRSCISTANAYLLKNPNDATVLGDRAMCYLLQRRYARALRDFRAAVRLSPGTRQYVIATHVLRRLAKGSND